MQLGMRSYYSIDTAPVKFRHIRSSFASPTVNLIAALLPVKRWTFSVSGNSCWAAFLFLSSALSPTPRHSPLSTHLDPLRSGAIRWRSNGPKTEQIPLTLDPCLFKHPNMPFWPSPPSSSKSVPPNHQPASTPPPLVAPP